jgi:hypothetical protein
MLWVQLQFPFGNGTKSLGVQVLENRGQVTHAYWYWLGVGALVGFIIIFNIGFTVAIAFMPGDLLYPKPPIRCHPHDDLTRFSSSKDQTMEIRHCQWYTDVKEKEQVDVREDDKLHQHMG